MCNPLILPPPENRWAAAVGTAIIQWEYVMDRMSEHPWLNDGEVQALHARALNLLQAGQEAAGAEILLALTLARPTTALLYRDLGLAWHRSGAWAKAWEAYSVASDLAPDDDITAALRAECAVQTLPVDGALRALEAVLARPMAAAAAPYVARVRQLLRHLQVGNAALDAAAAVPLV